MLVYIKGVTKLLLIPGIIGMLLIPAITSGEFDLQGLNKQVQHEQSVLDNHEARITNLEKDTTNLEEATQTPTVNHEYVPPQSAPVEEKAAPEAVKPAPTDTPIPDAGVESQTIN